MGREEVIFVRLGVRIFHDQLLNYYPVLVLAIAQFLKALLFLLKSAMLPKFYNTCKYFSGSRHLYMFCCYYNTEKLRF